MGGEAEQLANEAGQLEHPRRKQSMGPADPRPLSTLPHTGGWGARGGRECNADTGASGSSAMQTRERGAGARGGWPPPPPPPVPSLHRAFIQEIDFFTE